MENGIPKDENKRNKMKEPDCGKFVKCLKNCLISLP
jgi:hypothetical protein